MTVISPSKARADLCIEHNVYTVLIVLTVFLIFGNDLCAGLRWQAFTCCGKNRLIDNLIHTTGIDYYVCIR